MTAPQLTVQLPNESDKVTVVGFPVGGTGLSVTQGVVSRIEYLALPGLDHNLMVQVDAALNPGNSGGPAFANSRCIGIVTSFLQEGQNIGYVISGYEISLFLDDIRDGKYDGKPRFETAWQPLVNQALRARLGVDPRTRGVVVVNPQGDSADTTLQTDDVITHVGGCSEDMMAGWTSLVSSSKKPVVASTRK
jgi:S1-C subfamily serine protease